MNGTTIPWRIFFYRIQSAKILHTRGQDDTAIPCLCHSIGHMLHVTCTLWWVGSPHMERPCWSCNNWVKKVKQCLNLNDRNTCTAWRKSSSLYHNTANPYVSFQLSSGIYGNNHLQFHHTTCSHLPDTILRSDDKVHMQKHRPQGEAWVCDLKSKHSK